MRFGLGTDPVNGYSFKVVSGFASSEDPLKDSVKFLTHVDGSVEVVEFGSRQERIAEFTLAQIPKDQFVVLVDFLSARTGRKIHVTEENDGEKLFTESFLQPGPLAYFAHLLEVGGMQEEDFSTTRELFSLNVKIAFAHTSENPPDIPSKLDVLIDIDTVRADFVSPGQPSPEAGTLIQGMRWLETANDEVPGTTTYSLHEFTRTDGDPNLPGPGNWDRVLYAVPKDIPEVNFIKGVFYLSAFSDVSYDLNAYGEDDPRKRGIYMSGWINYQSIELPGRSINLSKGPAIAHREGFSFSINNSNDTAPRKFWAFLVENSVNLYGARCSISIFRNPGGIGQPVTLTKLMSGMNRSNSFTYTDYKFQVEPFLLNASTLFPRGAIDPRNPRYADAPPELAGKPPYLTYGEHEMAALQLISSKSKNLEFGFRFLSTDGLQPYSGATANIIGYIDIGYQPKPDDPGVEAPAVLKRIIIPSTLRRVGSSLPSSNFPATYDMQPEQVSEINLGDHVVQITFDNDEDDPDTFHDASRNGNKTLKILKAVRLGSDRYRVQGGLEEIGGHYLLVEDPTGDTLTDPLVSPGPSPRTESAIGLVIAKHAFKYQSGEADSGGFGVFEQGAFNSDSLALFNLKESQKELVQIPSTGFDVNSGRNLVRIDPVLAANAGKGLSFLDSLAVFGAAGAPILPQISPVFLRLASTPIKIDAVDYSKANNAGGTLKHAFVFTKAGAVEVTGGSLDSNGVAVGIRPLYTGELEKPAAMVMRFPINHGNDAAFSQKKSIRIALNAEIESRLEISFGGQRRDVGIGLSAVMRFRKYDGSYVEPSESRYPISAGKLSLLHGDSARFGNIRIDNLPKGRKGANFTVGDNADSLDDLFTRKISQLFEADQLDANRKPKDAARAGLYKGELAWWKRPDGSDDILVEWQLPGSGGTAPSWQDASTPAEAGDRIYLFRNSANPPPPPDYFQVISDTSGANAGKLKLQSIEPAQSIQTLKGMDLFDVSDFFDGNPANGEWGEFESLEILLIADDLRKAPGVEAGTPAGSLKYNLGIRLDGPPRLMIVDELSLDNRPAFSALRGKTLTADPVFSDSPDNALVVAADILKDLYPDNFNAEDFFGKSFLAASRRGKQWRWRKQFTKAMDSTRVFEDLLHNLWAAAVFDQDDNLLVKSLFSGDHPEPRRFDESNVLKDSVTEPRFRPANEIFQVFKLDYDWFPPAEFSNALEKYRKRKVYNGDKVEDVLSFLLRSSRDLFRMRNEYVRSYDYHYADRSLPFAEWLVRWFAFTSWTFKFRVSLDNVLGENRLELMDRISLENFFFTRVPGAAKSSVDGFVVAINPDIYEGTAEIGIYVPEPPGIFGPNCDPFNNALEFPDRSAMPANDASSFPRTGEPYRKDAGIFPRVITC